MANATSAPRLSAKEQQSQQIKEKAVVASQASGTATVSVACKHPGGLVLYVHDAHNVRELVMGGGSREVQQFQRRPGPGVTLYGPAVPFGMAPASQLAGGYAITPNVSKAFMDEWLKQNADTDLVLNKVVLVAEGSKIAGLAAEHKDVRSNLEPLEQKDDPRSPKRIEKSDVKGAAEAA